MQLKKYFTPALCQGKIKGQLNLKHQKNIAGFYLTWYTAIQALTVCQLKVYPSNTHKVGKRGERNLNFHDIKVPNK